jgi:hypothetical protein
LKEWQFAQNLSKNYAEMPLLQSFQGIVGGRAKSEQNSLPFVVAERSLIVHI